MRLTSSLILPALCCSAQLASASSAYLYTYDSAGAQRESGLLDQIAHQLGLDSPRTLSPVEARMVVAQRAGVEDYHAADLGRPGVLGAINEFGLKQALFDTEETRRITLLAEVLGGEPASPADPVTRLGLSSTPSMELTWKLFEDLETQQSWPAPPPVRLQLGPDASEWAAALENSSGSQFGVMRGTNQELDQFWRRVIDSQPIKTGRRTAITMLAFPISTSNGYEQSPDWAAGYTMPGASRVSVQRRAVDSVLTVRQDDSQSSPLPGILPSCFSSQSDCESTTRNCTGHGSCQLLYTDRSHGDDSQPCYACSCSATVSEGSNGQKSTTYWGGPACQKRDISMQFWLIALFSVGMVFLISFGIGSLWSMGEETLPSVIGAGVSGPTAKR